MVIKRVFQYRQRSGYGASQRAKPCQFGIAAAASQKCSESGVLGAKADTEYFAHHCSTSSDGAMDDIFVSNYANINIVNEIGTYARHQQRTIIGARDYSMRVWLRPDKLAQLALTTSDVVQAIQEQNSEYAVGRLGQPPNVSPVQLTVPVTTLGRLATPEEFDNIILRANPDGSNVTIKDVGHTDLGAQDYV